MSVNTQTDDFTTKNSIEPGDQAWGHSEAGAAQRVNLNAHKLGTRIIFEKTIPLGFDFTFNGITGPLYAANIIWVGSASGDLSSILASGDQPVFYQSFQITDSGKTLDSVIAGTACKVVYGQTFPNDFWEFTAPFGILSAVNQPNEYRYLTVYFIKNS